MSILFLEPVGGIAGDMFMAAAIDLGVAASELERALGGLDLPGWKLKVSKQERHHIGGTHVEVEVDPSAHVHARSLVEIRALISAAKTFSPKVKERALSVFEVIGRAEAKVHQVPLEEIHFHEVGAVDSIVDVCAASLILEMLGEPQVFAAPPPLGSGVAQMAHGSLPIPPPATLEILAGVPVRFEGEGELTTPTGAALIRAFAKVQSPPEFTLEKVGYGVGTKNWKDRANLLRMSFGQAGGSGERALVLEANLDDCSPQLISHVLEQALAAGALDAWVIPATMKKGRPGHLLGVLVSEELQAEISALLFAETTTLGLRRTQVVREMLERRHQSVETPYGTVRVKLGLKGAQPVNVHPEYEDCLAAAKKAGVAVKVVFAAALAAYQAKSLQQNR